MAKKSSGDSTLNDYFEAISSQDDEEKTWQRYSELLVSKIEVLEHYFKDHQPFPIGIRAFGSSVEKLKIFLPENIGDVDVMVFPLAEETKIPESIMEYSIPGNPVFVRLRGNDHALLRHCLAENSDHVASATLKDFHPKLFGDAKGIFELIARVFRKMQDIAFYGVTTTAVTKTTGPAFQFNFVQTRESLRDHVAEMKNLSSFKVNEDIRGCLEWMAIATNPRRPFTEEYSATIDEFAKISEEMVHQLSNNATIDNFESTLNKLAFDPKVWELRTKVQEIDRKEAEKMGNEGLTVSKEIQKGSVTEVVSEEQEDARENKGSPTKRGGEPKGLAIPIDERRFDSSEITEIITERTLMSGGQETNLNDKMGISLEGGQETDLATLTQKRLRKICIESVLGINNFFKISEDQEIPDDETKQKGGMDLVPAFLGKGWPSVAKAWISRDRSWPNPDVISNILESGFHLVVKTPNESDRPDLDFRLSFSHAEFILSKELNDIQRQCYRCLKSYLLTITRNIKSNIFGTYFLKTILFWAIEETGVTFWKSENRGTCVMMLLKKLLKALETKYLPHYFIPEYNLLGDVFKAFPEKLEILAEEVRKICEHPMSYPNVCSEESYSLKTNSSKSTSGLLVDDAVVDQTSLAAEDTSDQQGRASAKKHHLIATVPKNKENDFGSTHQQSTGNNVSSSGPCFPRYKDFQVLYREVYQELLNLALEEGSLDTKDPTTKSIVENIREVMSKVENNPKTEMERVFECALQNVYVTYVLHNGSDPRNKILSVLKGLCQMFAYVSRQDDLMHAPGNEYLILDRMLNSSSDGSSDSFDFSSLYPRDSNVLQDILGLIQTQFDPIKQRKDEDDIPLD